LIAGGWSNERQVSLAGAAQIETSLTRLGHRVVACDPSRDFDRITAMARECDFAFINLHGAPGEDGLIQALLNSAGCPYQGSGPEASFLALNKAAAKQLFRSAGLATPDWALLVEQPGPAWQPPFGFPLFVKPNTGGSSLGMSLVAAPAQLPAALETAFAEGREVLVEPALDGPEVTCAVLGDEALPPILIKPLSGVFFDYQSKYTQAAAEELCPAPLPPDVLQSVRQAALSAHRALRLAGCSRSDFILTKDGLFLLEVNTLPGMTPTSLLPKAAAAIGLDFDRLVARLIELGLPGGSAKA